jgi:hypothetical protein
LPIPLFRRSVTSGPVSTLKYQRRHSDRQRRTAMVKTIKLLLRTATGVLGVLGLFPNAGW